MDEIEEGQLSSDVQNSSKDDLEDDAENKLIDKKKKIIIDTNITNSLDRDCVLCGTYACICDKNSNDGRFKLRSNETEEGEIVESDNCSIKLKESSAIKPLLNKKQAKKRLQAFSSEKKSMKRRKSVPAKVPKVVVSIETQYDENGEVTEDKLVIRKVPKIGPNSHEKAKSVISEIEEIKRRSANMSSSYNHYEKMYPRSVITSNFKRHNPSNLIENENVRNHSTSHSEETRSRKRRSRSRERRHENDRTSSRQDHHHKLQDHHKTDRYSNSSWSHPPTTWSELKLSNRSEFYKRKVCEPVQFNMIAQLRAFEEDHYIKGTFHTANYYFNKPYHDSNVPWRLKFYYTQTIKWTNHLPKVMYCPNSKQPTNLFPNRSHLFKHIPTNRIPVVKDFLNSCTNTKSHDVTHNNLGSKPWYIKDYSFDKVVDYNQIIKTNKVTTEEKATTHLDLDSSAPVKSYGLSVLSENYQNHWGDESESEIGKKSTTVRITEDVLPEDISPEENVLDFTPEKVIIPKVKEIVEEKCSDQSPEVKTPDTDEYRSNWEIDEDPLIDYKSPQIWDSDDNSTLSRKASKKFQNNRYTNKKKFDFSDIAYNDKSNINPISNGLSDSFMNSFGYRRSTSRSDDGLNYKYNEKNEKYDIDKHRNKDRKYSKDWNSDDSRSKIVHTKDEQQHINENKRKHMSKINLSILEEDLEKKRKSIFKQHDKINKYYDEYDSVKRNSRSSSDKSSNHHQNNHVDFKNKHWENEEEDQNVYLSNRREKMWEGKPCWKEDDINEFRMQEKIKLNESLEEQNQIIDESDKSPLEPPPPPLPPPPIIEEINELNKPVDIVTNVTDIIENTDEITSPISTPPRIQQNSTETSNNNSKLVSEYEEFMKTVGFEASVQDEIFSNDDASSTKPPESQENIETKIKHKKIIKKRTKKSKRDLSSSSDDDSDDEQISVKKRKKSSSSSSSDSSSSSSSNSSSDSSASDSDSSDSSTSSSSSSNASSSKEEVENNLVIDPLKIKVEKVSDDEKISKVDTNIQNNSIKEEQLDKQKESSSTVVVVENSNLETIIATTEQPSEVDKVPIQVDNNIFEIKSNTGNENFINNTEFIDYNENSPVNISSNTTISLTLTPSKLRQQFKPLLLQTETNTDKNNSNTDTNPTSGHKVDDTEIDFTDIIMKRSREHSRTSQSPENKKQCIESKREKSKTSEDGHSNHSDKRSDRRRSSGDRSRNRDHHYRDDGKYKDRSRRDYSRERRRSERGEYRHSRRHFESESDRHKYYEDKYRDYNRSDRVKTNVRNNVRRSRSPLDKRGLNDSKVYKRDDTEKYRNSNSPLDGFKRSLADSTISDSELISQTLPPSIQAEIMDYKKSLPILITKQTSSPSVESPISPKRLSLDDRINQFLGIESTEAIPPPSSLSTTSSRRKMIEPPNAIYAQNSYDDYMSQDYYDRYANYVPPSHHYEGYHPPIQHNPAVPPPNFYPSIPPPTFNRIEMPPNTVVRPNSCTQVVQVGNVLQVVPTDLPSIRLPPYEEFKAVVPKKEEPPPPPECTKTKVVQVGNMIQIVPAAVLPEESVPQIKPEIVKVETKNDIKEQVLVIPSPVKIIEKAIVVVDDTPLKKKLEKEKRHSEREKRRAERESKRRDKQKRRDQRIKMKTEKMIKQALLLETSDTQVSDLDVSSILQDSVTEENENLSESTINNSSMQSMWPPPASLPVSLLDPPTKGILMKTGFSKIKTDNDGQAVSELGIEDMIKVQKTVKFADGINPGEGTSPSGGEELPSPPPPKRKLPKEQRYKKTKLKTKKKVKVKIIRPVPPPVEEDDDSDDNLPPPPPPPGSPPPHLWPPKYIEQPAPYPGPPPPHHPPFPLNHPPFPPNGAHLPPPGFIPSPAGALIPKNHCPPPVLNFPNQPPPMFPPPVIGPDGPPPPPFLEGRPPSGMNIPPGSMFVPKFPKM